MIKFKQYLLERINVEKTVQNLGDKLLARMKDDRRFNNTTRYQPKLAVKLAMEADPTPNQKYTIWILRTYINKGIKQAEDFDRTKNALEIFHKHKNRMSKKDINQIKSLSDLEDMVEPFEDALTTKEESKEYKKKIDNETTVVYKGSDGMILIPRSRTASCFWGRGTKWCTASTKGKNYFNYYHKCGYLYILIKGGKKYQFHFNTGSYMDARDEEISENSPIFPWFLNNVPEQIQLDIIQLYNDFVRYIENPSEKVQLLAISHNGNLIKYIKNPTEKVQLDAVKNNGISTRYIKNPSEQVQLAAVKNYSYAIQYIENPTEKVQLAAISYDSKLIQYIKNPTEKAQLAAVKRYYDNIVYIKNPTEKVKELAKRLQYG